MRDYEWEKLFPRTKDDHISFLMSGNEILSSIVTPISIITRFDSKIVLIRFAFLDIDPAGLSEGSKTRPSERYDVLHFRRPVRMYVW